MAFAVFCALFLGLLFVGLPIGFVFLVPSIVYMVMTDTNLVLLGQTMLQQFLKFVLLAIPLYVLAGELMNTAGITNRIFNFAHALVGHVRGGLGHVNVIGSMIFAGMSADRPPPMPPGWVVSRSRPWSRAATDRPSRPRSPRRRR